MSFFKCSAAQNGYCSLADGYKLTQHDEVTFNGVKQLSDGTFKVAITIVATELFATGPVTTTYVGYEVVDPGTWQITNAGRLDKTNRVAAAASPTSPDPIQAAQAVVQQFHGDINRHDYPEAYSLWGADFHHATDYCSFVKGYSQTRNEDVNIDNTTQLSDGTVQALATINATEDTDAGPSMKVYHETYIVGQEIGAWRIISGIVGS